MVSISGQTFVEDRTLAGIGKAREQFTTAEAQYKLRRYHADKAEWVVRAWIDTWSATDFADWSLDKALESLRCPLLAVHGDQDEYGSLVHPERMAAHGASVRILHNVGHTPHRECPELLADAVADWLACRTID